MKNRIKKKRFTLRQYITLYLGGLTLILVILYSILLNEYMIQGLDEASARDLHLAAVEFVRNLQINPKTPLPQAPRVRAFMGPEKLPRWVTRKFPPDKYRHAKLLVGRYHHEKTEKEHDFFLLFPYNLPDDRQLILLKIYSAKDKVSGINLRMLHMIAWPIGAGFILFVVLAVRYMLRRLSTPVEKLGDWAGKLLPGQIEQPHPDFGFDEVNKLADLLQDAMKQLRQASEREHRFLRNASHELRTPIAVAQSNLELLERVRPEPEKAEQVIYERIRRAVGNMNQLTQTLLWLNRDKEEAPSPEPVAIDALVSELVAENRYLLKGKSVSVSVDAKPAESVIIAVACRIALNNLIRNAFQYTAEGEISIRVRSDQVVIRNITGGKSDVDQSGSDYGFGLGLALVEQVTAKMGWEYQNAAISGGREVRIKLQ
ncbi:MAG: HAMP domain-containing histidine kinase [Desulfobacterales bacterium]|nr:HAMP domain-containing histidine kinase [Desulfobacterales bacterium]